MRERLRRHWREVDAGPLTGVNLIRSGAGTPYIYNNIGESRTSKIDAVGPFRAVEASLPRGATSLSRAGWSLAQMRV